MNTSSERIKQVTKLLAVGAIALAVAGCNKANSEISEPVVKPVKLVEVPDLSLNHYDSFIATIDATDRAALSFQVAGEIESVEVRMGTVVKKGQVLAKLDPTDYQLAFDARLAEYNLAKTAFERAAQLHDKKLISVDTFDQNETQFKAAQAALEQAKTDLDYTQIVAPFDGVVSITFSKEHQVVGANQPVLNLIDNSVLDVVLTVPVSYAETYGLDHIADSKFQVVMDSHKQISMPAQFKEISTQPDPDTNSYKASLTFKRPEQLNLLPGMTGQVKLLNTQASDAFKIAQAAWVSKQQEKGQLYRFDASTQTLSLVDVELDSNGNITGGVTSGDLIVQAGVENLSPGQQVKAWTKEGGI
ncbi:efflux RND transporter periplasmic adaptor subunit [Vibrio europaeus]|uniref:efflux RND transporter periplasmic adaptor subunit n=1 Tax=Vibrio oreintalis group TaxID=1891919 RepID=UPI001EFC93D4|nr:MULTISPECIES: efflux RND transporter periplasmic adaptor subunit [Vibrio oreintalis group]MCG9580857.1 efflux RND transporter periplasmic adaptor subunit [Vibrio tubiashii]MCG9614448.1 efflux RND transporter periplasmic adaptor subunit [Vibrio tubiashii]MCG9689973.1 efflux RND transporter periplasmic adaptor subunit [Vibrio tubiashii]MDC5806251.1 efflux RND transporter periplasmic adaptor subunit [Vibrio europaeus]MDC5825680.1 efflux RND transporter periplasmic adaptor subunit [Vibrio europ